MAFELLKSIKNSNNISIVIQTIANLQVLYNKKKYIDKKNSDDLYDYTLQLHSLLQQVLKEYRTLLNKSNELTVNSSINTINESRKKALNLFIDCQNWINSEINECNYYLTEANKKLEQLHPDNSEYDDYTQYVKEKKKHINLFNRINETLNNLKNEFNNEIILNVHKFPGNNNKIEKKLEKYLINLENTYDFDKFEIAEHDIITQIKPGTRRDLLIKKHIDIVIENIKYYSQLANSQFIQTIGQLILKIKEIYPKEQPISIIIQYLSNNPPTPDNLSNNQSDDTNDKTIETIKSYIALANNHMKQLIQAAFKEIIIPIINKKDMEFFKGFFSNYAIIEPKILKRIESAWMNLYVKCNIDEWYKKYILKLPAKDSLMIKIIESYVTLMNDAQMLNKDKDQILSIDGKEYNPANFGSIIGTDKDITSTKSIKEFFATTNKGIKFSYIIVNNEKFYKTDNQKLNVLINKYKQEFNKDVKNFIFGYGYISNNQEMKPCVSIEYEVVINNNQPMRTLPIEPVSKHKLFTNSLNLINELSEKIDKYCYAIETKNNDNDDNDISPTKEYKKLHDEQEKKLGDRYILSIIANNIDEYKDQLNNVLNKFNADNSTDFTIEEVIDGFKKVLNYDMTLRLPNNAFKAGSSICNEVINSIYNLKNIKTNMQKNIPYTEINKYKDQLSNVLNKFNEKKSTNYDVDTVINGFINLISSKDIKFYDDIKDYIDAYRLIDKFLYKQKNPQDSEYKSYNDRIKLYIDAIKNLETNQRTQVIKNFIRAKSKSESSSDPNTDSKSESELKAEFNSEFNNFIQHIYDDKDRPFEFVTQERQDHLKKNNKIPVRMTRRHVDGRITESFSTFCHDYIFDISRKFMEYIINNMQDKFDRDEINDIIADDVEKAIPDKITRYNVTKKIKVPTEAEIIKQKDINQMQASILHIVSELKIAYIDNYMAVKNLLNKFNSLDKINQPIEIKNINMQRDAIKYNLDKADTYIESLFDRKQELYTFVNNNIIANIKGFINNVLKLYDQYDKYFKSGYYYDNNTQILISNYDSIIKIIHSQNQLQNAKILVQREMPLAGKKFRVIAHKK